MSATYNCTQHGPYVAPTSGMPFPKCPVCEGESMPAVSVDEANDEVEAMMLETGCCMCSGPLVPMGQLGRRKWFRCRDCGHEESMLDD